MTDRIARYARNEAGRDFVVSDIHGCFDLVIEAMRKVGFDRTADRLFSVGDTIDRGPDSARARAFLECDFVYAVRGNHEDMFLEIYEEGAPSQRDLAIMLSTRTALRNGMDWWLGLDEPAQIALIERFRSLPIAIEVETPRGSVGLVHAEVPAGMDWDTFLRKVDSGCPATIKSALWGRDRIGSGDQSGVRGIDRLFCGHTPIPGPARAGNVYYLDTGAVFGLLKDDPGRGRLTMAGLTECSRLMSAAPPNARIDVRNQMVPEAPFGKYST